LRAFNPLLKLAESQNHPHGNHNKMPVTGIYSEPCDTILPHTATKRVVSGERILKVNKKPKGSRIRDQFHLVWDLVNNKAGT